MSAEQPANSPRIGPFPLSWRSFLGFVLFSIVLAFFVAFQDEMSYWYLAAAQNHLVKADFPTALNYVQQAQRWTPQAPLPWLVKTQVLLADHQLAPALEAAEAGLKEDPNHADLRLYRVWIMLELKREQELLAHLAPLENITADDVQERIVLAEALLHRDQANLAVQVLSPMKGHELETNSSRLLLCRALREAKRHEEALVESQAAFESSRQGLQRTLGSSDFFEETLQNLLHLKRYEDLLETIHAREIAVIKAKGDLRIVEQNGFAYYRAVANRELITAEAMALAAVANTGARADSVLDTLAYVLYRREKLKTALEFMNQTIRMLEVQSFDWKSINQITTSYRSPLEIAMAEASEKKKAAVYYYHRALIHLDLDQKEEAQKDLKRVTELGHLPGEDLF
jgi:tetratricopeptide (TPR) repeat protein